MSKQKGITLIALVITIIVLLILAGVTINMVLGDDGIIAQAQEAKKAQEKADEKESIAMAVGEAATTQYLNQIPLKKEELGEITTRIETYNNGTELDYEYKGTVSEIVDGVPIPLGFAHVEGTKKDTGLIIVDEYGNEFVWVPVDEKLNETMVTVSGDSEYDITAKLLQDEYDAMSLSVSLYGGFFVGRYETGGFNSERVVSKQGENQDSCTADDWYDAYFSQKKLHANSPSVSSGMIYGSQWDAIMDWLSDVKNPNGILNEYYIHDSTGMGHYSNEKCKNHTYPTCPNCIENSGMNKISKDSPVETGSKYEYQAKKIYDLAGNFQEYFLGSYYVFDTPFRTCTTCWGLHEENGADNPASMKEYSVDESENGKCSSRLQLYIK